MSLAEDPNLAGLYPFVHGKKKDPLSMNSALLESVGQKAAHHQKVIEDFFARNGQEVVAAAGAIADVYCANGRLLTRGNGASSCAAAHVAAEFLHPVTAGRVALTAIDLTADRTMMTAVANDVGFQHVFVRQLISEARAGDGLIGISTSGNSDNLINAFVKAKEMGVTTVGLAGMSGGEMAKLKLDHFLVVETDR